jgi:dual specificity tyrosine-phosphorylation-regulated kinase 2/3/4
MDFPQIYFIGGQTGVKKVVSSSSEQNYGYDDHKGNYKITKNDHIAYRYEILQFLGKGSFGIAVKCFDHKTKEEIALKIIKNKKKYYY